MNRTRRYSYDVPRRGVVAGMILYVSLSLVAAYLAKHSAEATLVGGLTTISVLFAVLAEMLVIRRLAYPRALELTDDAVLFPHGFPLTKIEPIRYADVIRIEDWPDCFVAVTGRSRFVIAACRFTDIEHYRAVRDFVSARTSIALPDYSGEKSSHWTGFPPQRVVHSVKLPLPLVDWVEPEDWRRYRTHLARSKPTVSRLAKEFWFFARCLAFILFPWLILWVSQLPTISAKGFLAMSLLATVFFTIVHWLNATYPVYPRKISFRDAGITRLACNGQEWNWNYHNFCAWAVIERHFRERALHILLLNGPGYILTLALPDADIRSRVTQILIEKHLPEMPDLKPPWEAE